MGMDHFKRDFAAQVCIERLVSNAHGAPTKLDWRPVFTCDQFILVEAMRSGGVIDLFVVQRAVEQTIDAYFFCAAGRGKLRAALRTGRYRFGNRTLVHAACAKTSQR